MIAHLGGFLAISAIVIITPGPDTVLTIRNSLAAGRRAGICTAAGTSTGQVIWAIVTTAGVSALLAASRPAFLAVKIAGAAYLIVLGLESLRAAPRAWPVKAAPDGGGSRRLRPRTAFCQGMLSNLGNPKMAVFFVSLLPQFTGRAGTFAALPLGLIFSAMTFAWLAGYAATAARATQLLLRPGARRALGRACGATLTGLGVWLVAEAR